MWPKAEPGDDIAGIAAAGVLGAAGQRPLRQPQRRARHRRADPDPRRRGRPTPTATARQDFAVARQWGAAGLLPQRPAPAPGDYLGLRLYRPTAAGGAGTGGLPARRPTAPRSRSPPPTGAPRSPSSTAAAATRGKRSFDVYFGLGATGDRPVSAEMCWRDLTGASTSRRCTLSRRLARPHADHARPGGAADDRRADTASTDAAVDGPDGAARPRRRGAGRRTGATGAPARRRQGPALPGAAQLRDLDQRLQHPRLHRARLRAAVDLAALRPRRSATPTEIVFEMVAAWAEQARRPASSATAPGACTPSCCRPTSPRWRRTCCSTPTTSSGRSRSPSSSAIGPEGRPAGAGQRPDAALHEPVELRHHGDAAAVLLGQHRAAVPVHRERAGRRSASWSRWSSSPPARCSTRMLTKQGAADRGLGRRLRHPGAGPALRAGTWRCGRRWCR